jgi:L-asparaginase / beta-aspartyl-peptidase
MTRWLLLIISLAIIVVLAGAFKADETEMNKSSQLNSAWAIALHGGAGVISRDLPEERVQEYFDSLEEALEIGEDILKNGGSALDAVEQVVRFLEDDPLFNAGRGSVFTNEGKHELDAAIMDGSTLAAGALTGLTTVKNPVTLARHVMENSRHVFFSGSGAEHYADQTEVERVENDWFFTQRRYEQWQRALQQDGRSGHPDLSDDEENTFRYGTVGASALDQEGRLAAATSTGGMTNKMYGRVGDVPIIGAGTYANDLVAVSATGWGEQIMRNVSAHTIASYMEFTGNSLEESIEFLLTERLNPGDAGFVAVDRDGNVSLQMNTAGMFRAGSNEEGFREVAIWD